MSHFPLGHHAHLRHHRHMHHPIPPHNHPIRPHHGCGCPRCVGNANWYIWPKPQPKRNRILNTTGLRIHIDKFVGESHFDKGPCCEPIPVGISEQIKSFIIRAATDCLEPSTYYTLYLDHPLCDNIWCMPSFIQVHRCGLFQDPIKLIETETVFPMCEFDGHPKCGIPADPAFPDQDLVHVERHDERHEHGGPLVLPSRFEHHSDETRLIPVELDLHGQTAFGDNFVQDGGPHPKQPLVLFYTNRATFSLTRPWWRRTDY